MATYAIRLQSVLGPVVERARRWSQSSTAEDRPIVILPNDDHGPAAVETTPPHSPHSLAPVFESSDVDSEDDASEETLVILDIPSVLPQMPQQNSNDSGASSTASLPALSPPEDLTTTTTTSDQPLDRLPAGQLAPTKSSALPEDDGQRVLRKKLVEISKLKVSEREKAKRMHLLMLEKYNASRRSGDTVGPTSSKQIPEELRVPQEDNPYKLSRQDIVKTYYTGQNPASELPIRELGCAHYRRGVKLQCSTCYKWYTCRFCHDENEEHALVRKETKNMLCMHCGRAQPVGQDCRYCGVRSARYYCDKCKLWDNDPRKAIYHCNDCGICRMGQGLGKDFFHCKKCGACMSIALEGSHRCIERSTECDCPICGEFLFTSTLTVVFMSCGHSIHHKCYYEHMKSSYRCPTCSRTIINMESQFRALDAEIEAQPLPVPWDKWRSLITCNDCSARGNVPFHFLGEKCDNCKSYNTSQIRVIRPEDGVDGAGNLITPSAIPAGLIRTTSSASLTAQPLNSPPRLARAEAGPTDGDDFHIPDDGWETEDEEGDTFSDDESEDEDEDEDEDGYEEFEMTKLSDEEGEDETEPGDPAPSIGHR